MNKCIKIISLILVLTMLFPSTVFAANEPVTGDIVDTSNHTYSYFEMLEDIQYLGQTYPTLMQVSIIGASADNRAIYQIVLGNRNAKNAIYIQCAMHGREWMNSWIMMKSLEVCLQNWNNPSPNGETYGQVFEDCCIYLLPMVNPDGVTISQYGINAINNEAIRQKCFNMRGASNPKRWKANANGVDLNRQFSVGWNRTINVTAPASEIYNGIAPFTEPEAIAIKNALEQRDFTAAITYHSMEGAIYWNVGQQGEVLQRTVELAVHCSNISGYKLDQKLSSVKGLEYNYMIFEKNIPAVCIETGTVDCPLPYSQWQKVWNENHMMMVTLAGCYQ